MASVRVRKSTGKLFLDFRYKNQRCREQTALADTPTNRRKLEKLLYRIQAEITLGAFVYGDYFPGSSVVKKLDAMRGENTITDKSENCPLFKEFTEIWFDESKVQWRQSYQSVIRGILDKRLLDHFGNKRIDRIIKADLMQFRAQLGKVTHRNGKGLSATHINRHMKILRMIMNEAADRYDFISPYRGIKPLRVQKSDIDPFSLEEIHLILKTVRADFKNYYTVRFFTGMRTAEIDGLQWRYVDFEKRQILIRETIVKGRTEYTKTDGSQREISMSQPVYEALLSQQMVTAQNHYVFCTSAGTPLSHNNVTKRVWYPLLKHLGLRRRRPYQTRHTAATLWLASGENPEWVARQMGHVNTEMLFRVYSRYVPNLTRRDGSAFERLLLQNSSEIEGEQNG